MNAAGEKITEVIGMSLPFTDTEYTDRNDRLRERIAEAGLDVLLLFHQESMFYLFGYDQLGYWVYQTAIIAPDARNISVLCRTVDHDMIVGLPNVHEVRTWKDDETLNPGQLTVDWLSQLGHLKHGARVGIEMQSHALLPFYYETIKSAMPEHASLVDASHLVTELRVHKSETEIAYMREAGNVMDAAYAGAFEAFREGALETEILAGC